jgi:hypothetical protein
MKRMLIFSILFALAVLTPLVHAQDIVVTNAAAFAGTGTFNIKGNIVDSATANIHITGKTNLVGTKTQYVGQYAAAGDTLMFDTLQATGGSIDSMKVPVKVDSNLVLSSGTLTTAGKRLTVMAASSATGGTLLTNSANDTVVFNGANSQTVLGGTYNTLRMYGKGAKDFGGAVNAVNLQHFGGALTVDQNITATGTAFLDTVTAINAGKTVTVGSNPDTIKALFGNSGNIVGGAGSLTFLHSAANNGNITGGTGKITFDTLLVHTGGTIASGPGGITFVDSIVTTGPATILATGADTLNFLSGLHNKGSITLDSTSVAMFGGNFSNTSNGVLNFGDTSTVIYTGGAQAIYATHYGNLVAAGSSDKTSDNDTVKGSLKLTRNIAMNATKTLLMTSSVAQNVSDTGEVRGTVERKATYIADTLYAFNRANVGLAIQAHAAGADSISMTMADGTAPDNLPTTRYVNRKYTIGNLQANDTLAQAQLYYADNELENITPGASENKLSMRDLVGATWSSLATTSGFAKVPNTAGTENTIYETGTLQPLASVIELGLFNTVVTPTTAGAVFTNPAQWSSGQVPDSTDDVEINQTGVKVGASPAFAGTLTIDHGFDLTVDASSLTVGNSTSGFVSLSGALTINPSETLTINHGKLSVYGTITNNGTVNINP